MQLDPRKPIIIMVGTRPEGIKMMPLYFALKKANLPILLCSSGQHNTLLNEVFDLFNIVPDHSLHIMKENQDLFHITTQVLEKTKELFNRVQPSLILVQGDTTTALATALAAFYLKIPIGHVEAGLRTSTIWDPYPEEVNRRFISTLMQFNFAPTAQAAENLCQELIDPCSIYLTGNTIVDALRIMKEKIDTHTITIDREIKKTVDFIKQQNKSLVLLTTHRRESFQGGIQQILKSVKRCAEEYPQVIFYYPVHPNPAVKQAVMESNLAALNNIILSEPLSYQNLTYLLLNADWIVTDSGGVCEEAVSVSKPALIVRKETERPEAIWSGLAYLVGTNEDHIFNYMQALIERKRDIEYASSPFGDGYAAEKIVTVIKTFFDTSINKKSSEYSYLKKGIAMKKVCIVGLGYIGLPTAIVAAQNGFDVVGFDIDTERVKRINNCDPVIEEPEIFEKLKIALGTGNFSASEQIRPADYFIIAVPTPFNTDKSADLSYLWQAVESIACVLSAGNTIILESTVPVKTTELLAQKLQMITKMKAGIDFYVSHCPERVLPGKIFEELIYNARIIGGINIESVEKTKEFYKQFVKGPLYLTSAATAEMVKLVENSSRDVQIAFANQVAAMAYELQLNPFEVIELANKHPRVSILNPGCGVGGHCIAVDPWFLINSFPNQTELLHAARKVNEKKPAQVLHAITKKADEWKNANNRSPRILLLGLTYKADIDDLRESPALQIAKQLQSNKNVHILLCEPHISPAQINAMVGHPLIDLQEGLSQADIIVCLVKHKEFRNINKEQLSQKVVFDICGLFHEPSVSHGLQEYTYWPTQNAYYSLALDTELKEAQ